MAVTALIQRLGALATYRYGVDSYDSTKLGLGPLMVQNNGGAEASYAGPMPIGVAHPFEQAVANATSLPWSMRWQANAAGDIDWVFFIDNSAASTTRKLTMYTFDRRASAWTWVGYTTVTTPSGGNLTVRGFSMTYDLYTAGTVTGTAGTTSITGTSTAWSTSRIPIGCRIGFGSTDPTQITAWYEISAIGSDTTITLTTNLAGNVSGNYVIEDLRAVFAITSSTANSGGLIVVKGLRKELFTTTGITAVGASSGTDGVRGSYWLADAATATNNTAFGLAVAAKTSWTSQYCYIIDTTTTPIIYKYDVRAALTLASGKSTSAFLFKTNTNGTLSGTPSQYNNLILATTNHGAGSGKPCLYFTTTTYVYRTADVTTIANNSSNWLTTNGDKMTEIPPGATGTFVASSNMQTLSYLANIDSFVITTASSTTGYRNYVTKYYNDGATQMDRVWGVDIRQTDITTTDSTVTPVPSYSTTAYTVYCDNGLCYLAGVGTAAITDRVYAVPLGADWEYTGGTTVSKCYLVLPAQSVSDATVFTNVFANDVQVLGGKTGNNLGLGTEPLRLSYRTSGISDDSGSWAAVDSTGVIAAATATQIQLRVEFRTIGLMCIPARVCSVGVAYEDATTDSHFQPSVTLSDITNSRFAWRFVTAFNGTVPAMRVRLYDATSPGSAAIIDDSISVPASPAGTFESSTNAGTSWSTYDSTHALADKSNETTYVRYTVASASLSSINGKTIQAVLTLK